MAKITSKEQLRLAFSYRDSVRGLLEGAEASLAEKAIDNEKYASIVDFYSGHLQRAENAIVQIQNVERRKCASLERELQECLRRQSKLREQAAHAEIDARTANEQNRYYSDEIARLKRGISASRELVDAASAADLGGHVKKSLEDYSEALEADRESHESPKTRSTLGVMLAVGIALVLLSMGLAVFGLLPSSVNVALATALTGPENQKIQVTVRNEGSTDIVLYVPWTEEMNTGEHDGGELPIFGLQVYVAEKPEDQPRLLPASERSWQYRGFPLAGQNPFTVPTGLSFTVVMDTTQLQYIGVEPATVRLVLVDVNGNVHGESTTRLRRGAA